MERILCNLNYQVEVIEGKNQKKPDILRDIMLLDFESKFVPGEFDLVLARVPYEYYCQTSFSEKEKLKEFDGVVHRILDIIEYLAPDKWWIESIRSGKKKCGKFWTHTLILISIIANLRIGGIADPQDFGDHLMWWIRRKKSATFSLVPIWCLDPQVMHATARN